MAAAGGGGAGELKGFFSETGGRTGLIRTAQESRESSEGGARRTGAELCSQRAGSPSAQEGAWV